MEFAGIRFLAGNYGFGVGLGLFTLRSEHFFWDVIRAAGGGRSGDCGDGFGHLQIGTGVGVPVHLGSTGFHEFRLSLALMFGRASTQEILNCDEYEKYWDSYGTSHYPRDANAPVHLAPAVSYVWHAAPYIAIEVGVELSIALHNSDGDYAPPVFNGFIGFRI